MIMCILFGTLMYLIEGPEAGFDSIPESIYWCISTISTVGYGDISGTNNLERVFCSICMFIGVISFSIGNGSLASIIQNYD